MIFDLGSWDYGLLAELSTGACYYRSGTKANATITITGVPFKQQWRQPPGQLLFSLNLNKSWEIPRIRSGYGFAAIAANPHYIGQKQY